MAWYQWLTLGIAVLGAGLGIVNTWQAIKRDRVRLKVRPLNIIGLPASPCGIEVINLSSFPVTIDEVGFTLGDGGSKSRLVIPNPLVSGDGSWPRRLGARESFTAYFDPSAIDRSAGLLRRAYADTACGNRFEGWAPAMTNINELRS